MNEKKLNLIETIFREPGPLVVIFEGYLKYKSGTEGFKARTGGAQNFLSGRGVGGYLSAFAKLSGLSPRVGVLAGDVNGGSCTVPALCDALVCVEGGHLSFIRAEAVEKITGTKVDLEEFSGVEMHCSRVGTGDKVVLNDLQAIEWVKKYLAFFPASFHESPPCVPSVETAKAPQSEGLPFESKVAFDIREMLSQLVDKDSFLEIKETYSKEVVTGFARIGGRTIGIIGNNSICKFGAIFVESSGVRSFDWNRSA